MVALEGPRGMPRKRPPYLKPPKDRCDVCGSSLYGAERYKARLYLKAEPYRSIEYKALIVCTWCLVRLRSDKRLRKLFKIKYRRMPALNRQTEI